MTGPDDTDLAVRLSVPELVAVYEQSERDIRDGFAKLRGATDRLTETVALGGIRIYLGGRHGGHYDAGDDEVERVVGELRRSIWQSLVERLELRRLMSVKAWEDLTRKLDSEEPPAITQEIVEGMVRGFAASVPEMLEDAVKEVFNLLRPPGSRYKTNTEFEIGERVCLSHVLSDPMWGRTWSVEYNHRQDLIALENVFELLDGKRPGGDGRHYSAVQAEIERIPKGQPCHGATPLMEFRGYKNRSLHLRFRRMDLVRKLNAIAGGVRLKPQTEGEATS